LGANGSFTADHYTSYKVSRAGYPNNILDQTNIEIQNIPRWTYTLSADYEFDTRWAGVRTSVLWSHRSSANLFENALYPTVPGGPDGIPLSLTKEPGYGVLSGSVSFDVHNADLKVTFWGKNILNKRYTDSIIATAGTVYASFGAPATYGVDVTKRF